MQTQVHTRILTTVLHFLEPVKQNNSQYVWLIAELFFSIHWSQPIKYRKLPLNMNPVFVVLHPTRNCRAEILDSVDNFAILCLDIVWCYLCLENISELPDAGMCYMSHCEIP